MTLMALPAPALSSFYLFVRFIGSRSVSLHVSLSVCVFFRLHLNFWFLISVPIRGQSHTHVTLTRNLWLHNKNYIVFISWDGRYIVMSLRNVHITAKIWIGTHSLDYLAAGILDRLTEAYIHKMQTHSLHQHWGTYGCVVVKWSDYLPSTLINRVWILLKPTYSFTV